MAFFIEVLVAGLLAGVMYSLVALGFVLIYKASGVFNFAQGAMVLFAALTFVNLEERGIPFWAAIAITLVVMVLMAVAIERLMLRPLANQPPMSLFMATIGLAIIIEGVGQLIWGSKGYGLDLGIKDVPFEVAGVAISKFDLFAAGIAGTLVAVLVVFFNRTATGRALRAVADDHQAAMSIGIPLASMWRIVWAISGAVALITGLIWGSRLGVQFGLVVVALKALPVLILGGFTSVAGAIVGGLVIGATEKLAEVYLGGYLGGGIENWFPYVFAMLFLLVRPHGLFGEQRIERV
ncbi:MAG: branched-chain amino acid ABC transporter permease [Burkholderiaceae bacterium]|nr:branched-chain amino acid ABC transporter permease [Burkholderiaceae bacterium]